MTSLDVFHYIFSAALVVVALAVIFISISVVLLIFEIRRTVGVMRKAIHDMQKIQESFHSGMLAKMISYGKHIFDKNPHNE